MQRKHTTTACSTCRDSKTKCDGIRPFCGSCTKKGKFCEYSSKDDKRKISLRSAVEVLIHRVALLTGLANENGIQIPAMSTQEQQLVEQVCDNLELPALQLIPAAQLDASILSQQVPNGAIINNDHTDLTQPMPQSQLNTDIDLMTVGNQVDPNAFNMQLWPEFTGSESYDKSPSDWSWQILNDFSGLSSINYALATENFMFDSSINMNQPTNTIQNSQMESGASSDDEAENDIVPGLAARLGSLRVATDGRLRYYGTASNNHFLGTSSSREGCFDVQEMQRKASIALENAQLDQEIPVSLQKHFIELFFQWHNPSHQTVDKAMFEATFARDSDGQGEWCSQSLVAAICAIGSAYEGRYHQSLITFPKSMSDFFADKSKVLLEVELDSPCVSTVQTLLLLSCHEFACGRDVRMWLYGGMAMRLAFDVGLHVDSDPYVKQGVFTAKEAEARRSCFWSCVVVNQLWSFSLGRPFRVDSEELTVKPPGDINYTSTDAWANIPKPTTATSATNGTQSDKSSLFDLITAQWVALCNELAPFVRVLYGCAKISQASLQALSVQTTVRLLNWHNTIPDEIKISADKTAGPEVVFLHMAYHSFCILIHRPWTSKSSQPRGKLGPGHQHARHVCRNSASEIASLLRMFETGYGFRRMNVYAVTIIFSASLILIFGLIAEEWHDESEKREIVGNLNTCFRALDDLGRNFECAKHSHEQLLAIQKHWTQRRRNVKKDTKRKELEGSGMGMGQGQKRPRSS